MLVLIRNKLIAFGFKCWARYVRAKSTLMNFGRPRLRGVDHITLPVTNLELAKEFYCKFLGAAFLMKVDDETFKKFGRLKAPNNGEGSHHISVYLGGSIRIDLFFQTHGQASPDLGHPHYAFEVRAGELLHWKERLKANKIPVEGPLQLGPPGQASLYFNDPFGNHLEITCLGYCGEVERRPPMPAKLVWKSDVA